MIRGRRLCLGACGGLNFERVGIATAAGLTESKIYDTTNHAIHSIQHHQSEEGAPRFPYTLTKPCQGVRVTRVDRRSTSTSSPSGH